MKMGKATSATFRWMSRAPKTLGWGTLTWVSGRTMTLFATPLRRRKRKRQGAKVTKFSVLTL